jgi:hypothetical protein
MADLFSDLPGWAKGAIIALALGGTNGLQYLGVGAPAQSDVAMAKQEKHWCLDELSKAQAELRKCWQECSR